MKVRLTTVFVLFFCFSCIAQFSPKPFIIKGKLANCPEQYLLFSIENDPWMSERDTIRIEADGSFYFETTKVTKPQRISIQRNNVQFNDLFIAPGYELTITADVKDFKTLVKTRKFSGIGAEANRYRLLVDSLVYSSDLVDVQWYKAEEAEFIDILDQLEALREQARKQIFEKQEQHEPYFQHFNRVAELDNTFIRLTYLLAYINSGKVPLEEGAAFMKTYFNNEILDQLLDEKWLISDVYKDYLVLSEYLRYIRALDFQRDSTLKDRRDYNFHKVATTFPGKLKDYALAHMATMNFSNAKTIEQLEEHQVNCQPYMDQISDPYIQEFISHRLAKVFNKIGKIRIGGPAPAFSLHDPSGNLHKLEDFRGKVVYVDLWASWCGPCREETPYLNDLIKSYENDDRIAFVSIAVRDDRADWRKALTEDQPLSLQLYDADRFVYSTYVLGSIPQFVLIDQQGNLLNINAPKPSQKEEIKEILKTALNRRETFTNRNVRIFNTGSHPGKLDLTNRAVRESTMIADNSMATGIIVVNICVDGAGDVISASIVKEDSTTTDHKLIAAAIKNAKAWKFSKSSETEQCGTITYSFKLR